MKQKVSLGLNRMSVPDLIGYALHLVSIMTGNAFFATPSPTLARLSDAVTALQNAYNLSQGGGPAQTSKMHHARTALETLLTALGHYVEDVANDPANANTGADAIILSAGMEVKHVSPRKKRGFTVDQGETPGSVILTAESVKRGSHEWQYRQANMPDAASGPEGWISVTSTTEATTTIEGLESGKRHWFRHRAILPGGPAAYDGPVSIIVQ